MASLFNSERGHFSVRVRAELRIVPELGQNGLWVTVRGDGTEPQYDAIPIDTIPDDTVTIDASPSHTIPIDASPSHAIPSMHPHRMHPHRHP